MASVLLIDDEPTIQTVLRQMLQAGGHEVAVGRVGHELLEDLRLREFDLVITDLNMPVLDGWDVASWIRERRPGVPIIAIGGSTAFRANDGSPVFDAILQKPFRRADLLKTVSCLLDAKGGREAGPRARERRVHVRYGPKRFDAYLMVGPVAHRCRVLDISAGGARVRGDLAAPVGEAASLAVSDQLHLAGRIVRANGGDVALAFQLSDETRQTIDDLVQRGRDPREW